MAREGDGDPVFRERLRSLRESKDLTQSALGEILNVSKQTISNYENGVSSPDQDSLSRLADYFNVSTDYLLGRTDDPRTLRDRLAEAAQDDPELREFWEAFLSKRDLRLAFRTLKDLTPQALRQALRIIKALEEEEGGYVPNKPES
jgi:transcriptional regulator with XRE-family HTH domain